MSFSYRELFDTINLLIYDLRLEHEDLDPEYIFNMVEEANISFRQKSMPGSWRLDDDDEEIRLVPGLDFSWLEDSVWYWNNANDDCAEMSWEEILTGVPKGDCLHPWLPVTSLSRI